jgi:hypothetical protein
MFENLTLYIRRNPVTVTLLVIGVIVLLYALSIGVFTIKTNATTFHESKLFNHLINHGLTTTSAPYS